MKKIIFSLVLLSLLIQIPVFAAETAQEAMSAILPNQSAGASVPDVAKPVNLPQLQMLMANQMVVTKDGDVIVLLGWRLLKYDADLNLVKEVRLPAMRPPVTDKPALAAEKTGQPAAAELLEKVI